MGAEHPGVRHDSCAAGINLRLLRRRSEGDPQSSGTAFFRVLEGVEEGLEREDELEGGVGADPHHGLRLPWTLALPRTEAPKDPQRSHAQLTRVGLPNDPLKVFCEKKEKQYIR